MTTTASTQGALALVEKIRNWLRSPDWTGDEGFDLLEWANRRPIAALEKLAAAITAQAADIERLRGWNLELAAEANGRGEDIERLKAELAGRDAEIARKDAVIRAAGTLVADVKERIKAGMTWGTQGYPTISHKALYDITRALFLASDAVNAAHQPTETLATQSGVALDDERVPTWPSLKKALWHVVTGEMLNDGHYINAYDLTDKLYAALTQSGAGEPVVKALVWEQDRCTFRAEHYRIDDSELAGVTFRFWLYYDGKRLGSSPSFADAEAAAQAHYERRILSALTSGDGPAQEGKDEKPGLAKQLALLSPTQGWLYECDHFEVELRWLTDEPAQEGTR